jgi:hypothetical protein
VNTIVALAVELDDYVTHCIRKCAVMRVVGVDVKTKNEDS